MTRKNKILLNCLPPVTIYNPNPAFSILKSFLNNHNYPTEIKYWNFLFNSIITGEKEAEETDCSTKLMPFNAIIADMYKDREVQSRIRAWFYEIEPHYNLHRADKYENYIDALKSKIYTIINAELERINFEEVLLFGVSFNLLQSVPAFVLSRIVKEKYPDMKIVAGGIANKAYALEIMKKCKHIDFAIWGEGEYPLLGLINQLESCQAYAIVPGLIFREGKRIMSTNSVHNRYLDFDNYLLPDFTDYKSLLSNIQFKKYVHYPINSIRSCYRKKGKPCNHHTGYKYRKRPAKSIVEEIHKVIENYNGYAFEFVDNDIIGSDNNRFMQLLDMLHKYREETGYDFTLKGEIIPDKKLSGHVFRRMASVGFSSVLINLEALSDRLSHQAATSTDFAVSLFVICSALRNHIEVNLNVGKSVPDELVENVLESIDNLHYLRFCIGEDESKFYVEKEYLISGGVVKHNASCRVNKIEEYNSMQNYYITASFLGEDTQRTGSTKNLNEWNIFSKRLSYYEEMKFSYFFSQKDSAIVYHESAEGRILKTIEFDQECVEILRLSNQAVLCFDELYRDLVIMFPDITKRRIILLLDRLKSQYLLYFNKDFSKIVSIVDVERGGINEKK